MLKWNFAPVQNAWQPFFPSSNKFCHFVGFKTCKKPSISCSWWSQKGSGSIPDLMAQTDLHALTLCKHACKTDVHFSILPSPYPKRVGISIRSGKFFNWSVRWSLFLGWLGYSCAHISLVITSLSLISFKTTVTLLIITGVVLKCW